MKHENFNTLNEKNIFDESPFYIACLNGQTEIVKMIINDQRFNTNTLNEKEDHGDTPFSIACANGYTEIVEIILDHKDFKSLNSKNNEKNTAFMFAC